MTKSLKTPVEIPHILIPGQSVTVMLDNKPYSRLVSHPNFQEIVATIPTGNIKKLEVLLDIPKTIQNVSFGNVTIENGKVLYRNNEVHGVIVDRILQFLRESNPVGPLVNFLRKLMENPSPDSRNDLYSFMETNKLLVLKNGNFLAYKRVNEDFTDCYSGKISNKVGTVHQIPRENVDPDHSKNCGSSGFHAGGFNYVSGYKNEPGKKVMLVEINPAHVVSVASIKLRVYYYKVRGEVPLEDFKEFTTEYAPAAVQYKYVVKPMRDKSGRFIKQGVKV